MNCTFCPVSLLEQDAAHLRRRVLVDESDLPGLAFIHATRPFRSSAGRSFLRDHQLRIDRNQPDRLEILLQIVVELVDDAADMGIPLADVDGVAVGRRARDAPDRDAAARAADVLDDDRLAEQRPHALGHDARDDIGRSARRKRNDERDRARRIGLGLRLRAGDAGQRDERQRNDAFRHVTPRVLANGLANGTLRRPCAGFAPARYQPPPGLRMCCPRRRGGGWDANWRQWIADLAAPDTCFLGTTGGLCR